jgi:microcystin-dependent protein
MALPVRKGYKGAPAQAVLTNSPNSGDTSFVVDTVTGWATTFPFYCVVDPGTSKEEKVKVTAISTLTLTVVRAQDDTSASGHNAGAAIYPIFTADEADEANEIASAMTTKGDLIGTDGSTINRLAVGTNTHVLQADSTATNGVKWGQVATAGIADSAITSAKILDATIVAGDIADGAITSAKILDGTIALADLATAVANALVPVGTIVATARTTAPTGWLMCDGTSTTGYTTLASYVGATTPDMRGLFPIGKTASSTGSTLLGTGGTNTIATVNLPSHSHASTAVLTSGTVSITDLGHTHTIADHSHTNQVTTSASSGAHDNIANFVAAGTNGASTSTGVASISTASLSPVSNTTGISASVGTAITMTNASTGSGTAYFQPFIAVNYIIKHD